MAHNVLLQCMYVCMSIQDYGHSIYTSVGMFPILINKTNTSSDMINISQPFQNVFKGSEPSRQTDSLNA